MPSAPWFPYIMFIAIFIISGLFMISFTIGLFIISSMFCGMPVGRGELGADAVDAVELALVYGCYYG